MGKFLSILFCILISNSILTLAQDRRCSYYKDTSNFSTCIILPVQNSMLHWTYHQNGTVDMAYRRTGVEASSWVAWGLNLDRPAMAGTQALVAIRSGNLSGGRTYTSSVDGNNTQLQESRLSIDVRNLRSERVFDNVVIYATLVLPSGRTSFSLVWQSGPVSNGAPGQHALNPENRNSMGTVDFVTGALAGGGAGGNVLQNAPVENPVSSPTGHQNPTTGTKIKNKTKLIIILIGTIVPLIFLPLGLLWCLKKREQQKKEEEKRKRDEYFLELTASDSFKDVHHLGSNGGKGNDLLIFSFASIMAATNDFSIENKLGQGGFGPVYKGQLKDGQEIAIKRLSRTSAQGLVEFKNELILIAKLQHTNLVRVLGCCIHKEEKMLIYEYMPNKSLDFFLFDENKKVELDWPKRFNIIEGIAQGLLYLHKYSRMRVIHRDLKANNILLDENMNPKIADFGMARMFKQNETHAMTNRVVGTFGYMPPEYVLEGTFSIKSDIFSFGVLILEIVSGRKNSSFVHLDRTINLIGYAWELWQQGNALELEDTTLKNTCVVQQFLRTVHVALLCVQESATDRPTTSDMISMLLNDTAPLPAPSKPAFLISKVESESTSEENKPKHDSINNMTISAMAGR